MCVQGDHASQSLAALLARDAAFIAGVQAQSVHQAANAAVNIFKVMLHAPASVQSHVPYLRLTPCPHLIQLHSENATWREPPERKVQCAGRPASPIIDWQPCPQAINTAPVGVQAHLRANAAAIPHGDMHKQQAELSAKQRNDAMKDLSPGDRCADADWVQQRGVGCTGCTCTAWQSKAQCAW